MAVDSIRRRMTDGLGGPKSEPHVLVVGGEAAKGLASHLAEDRRVVLLSDDEEVVRAADRDGIEARETDITSGSGLAANVDGEGAAIVAAERDRVSLLSAQLLRTVCDVADVAVLLNDPANRELFEDIDVEFLEGRKALGRRIERTLFGEPT